MSIQQPKSSSPTTWSDGELRERVLEGDGAAWRELRRRFRTIAYHCITRVTSRFGPGLSKEDVDDIYAELMLALVRDDMRKLRSYDPTRGMQLVSWIGLLANHVAHDYLRTCGRHASTLRIDHIAELEDETADPLDRVLTDERCAQLLEALADEERWLLSLYYRSRLSPDEIAAQMNIAVKTVYSKKHRVYAKLRGLLAEAS